MLDASNVIVCEAGSEGVISPGESSGGDTNATLCDSTDYFTPKSEGDGAAFEHIVQFYDTQEYLLNILTDFIVPILQGRDAALVIATQERLDILQKLLRQRGVHVDNCKSKGQLVLIDAHETLETIMECDDNNSISIESFGSVLNEFSNKFAKTYVYGELVNILCAKGDHKSAVKLEKLWNDLMQLYEFTLLCGYDINNFKGPHLESAFEEVCCTHSRMDYSSSNKQGTIASPPLNHTAETYNSFRCHDRHAKAKGEGFRNGNRAPEICRRNSSAIPCTFVCPCRRITPSPTGVVSNIIVHPSRRRVQLPDGSRR